MCPCKKRKLGHRYCDIVIYNKNICLVFIPVPDTELLKSLEFVVMRGIHLCRADNHVIRRLELSVTCPESREGRGWEIEFNHQQPVTLSVISLMESQ